MPEHGKLFGIPTRAGFVSIRKADEVKHERINNFVGQLILLVDKHPYEQGVGT